MQLRSKLKENLSKKKLIFICAFSITCVFNFFIFSQFDIMFHNQAEFGISVREAVLPFLGISSLILLALIAALTAVCVFAKRAFPYVISVLLGLILASYIQILFMNKVELMALNGSMALESMWQFILNIFVYLLIAAVPTALLIFEKKKKKNFAAKLALGLCIIILGMQSIGLVTAAASAPKPAKGNELYYFSIDEQLKLSKNDNIVVFVLDRFDTNLAEDIFREYPQTEDVFSGFTFYTNNISEYPMTFPSVASFLTNKPFDKNTSKQIEYLQDAWANETLFPALKDKHYKANGLLDSIATFYDFRDLTGKFDNIKKFNKQDRVIRGGAFFGVMLSLAQTRQSPDCFKWAFVNSKYLDIANYCIKIKNTDDYYPRTVSANADLKFYHELVNRRLTANETDNVFSFVHLQASHDAFMYDEELRPGKSNGVKQTRGTLKILNEYFTQMKDLGIYESSTIIVMADHGNWENMVELVHVPMTGLLIKEKGTAGGTLRRDAHSQLSNYNFSASILDIIGAQDKKTTPSYFDIINNGGTQTRYFYYVKWLNLNSCTYINSYEVIGDANDINNWHKLPK